MPRERPRILVVDVDAQFVAALRDLLRLYNYEVAHAKGATQAKAYAQEQEFDALVISLDMPEDGFELSHEVRRTADNADVPLAFFAAGEPDSALLMEAQFYGALFLIPKPYAEVELLAQLSTMVRIKLLQDELKQRMGELDQLASTDPLTGLYNRRMFFRRMDEEVARAARSASPVSLIYVDIDHFKQINDTHGHAAGDAVLQQLARIMSRILRRGDVLGRIGGEEFLILLPGTPGVASQRIAERLRQRVEHATILYGNTQLKITISAGVFHVTDPVGMSVDDLVKVADEALYEAKAAGRNCVIYRGD